MSGQVPDRLLLFDIDGTLIASGGAGIQALKLAAAELLGIDGELGVEIAGRTDTRIVKDMLALRGIPETPEFTAAFLTRYLQHLAALLPTLAGRVLPGIVPLLDALAAMPHCALGLLTGNLQRGAELKLTHYGVWGRFPIGAYADDHHDRNQLGPVALARAREKWGIDFAPRCVFIIGDTPHDISCARAIGAQAVAVATGGITRETLATHTPEFLYDDFSDWRAVLAALCG